MHTFRLFQPYTQVVQGIFDKHTGNISPRFSSRIQIKEVTAAIKAELLLKAKVFTVDQVHGSTIVIVDQSNVAKVNHPQAADGLITSLPHVLLLIKTASILTKTSSVSFISAGGEPPPVFTVKPLIC
ncbi:MAG: laccase domain-containing protein [Candidatus Chisholmbacteria bacterium]|nr:laccase domain-containing protein [Candidatus Chisholmbacteria bacterium]